MLRKCGAVIAIICLASSLDICIARFGTLATVSSFQSMNSKVLPREIQGGNKVPDPRGYVKVLKLNNFPGDFLMTVLPIVCNHAS
jgi:hypothetical protein